MTLLIIAAGCLVLLCFVLLWILARKRARLGVLAGKKPVYQDTEEVPGEILSAKTLPLFGKPDYLLKEGKYYIPVELKTGKSPKEQFLNHNMQLMAYCLLVEEHYGIRPPGGYIKYTDKELKLAYTKEAEKAVRLLVAEILKQKKEGKELHCKHAAHYKE